jgi:hypothetical protein
MPRSIQAHEHVDWAFAVSINFCLDTGGWRVSLDLLGTQKIKDKHNTDPTQMAKHMLSAQDDHGDSDAHAAQDLHVHAHHKRAEAKKHNVTAAHEPAANRQSAAHHATAQDTFNEAHSYLPYAHAINTSLRAPDTKLLDKVRMMSHTDVDGDRSMPVAESSKAFQDREASMHEDKGTSLEAEHVRHNGMGKETDSKASLASFSSNNSSPRARSPR